jgi:hypothetical protein
MDRQLARSTSVKEVSEIDAIASLDDTFFSPSFESNQGEQVLVPTESFQNTDKFLEANGFKVVDVDGRISS